MRCDRFQSVIGMDDVQAKPVLGLKEQEFRPATVGILVIWMDVY